jgi:uncharacterized protein YecE (DUF72 family)
MISIGCDFLEDKIKSGSADFITLGGDENFNYFIDNNDGENVVVKMSFEFTSSSIHKSKRIWNMFWNEAGGSKLNDMGILHCIVIPFYTRFEYSERNVRKIRGICSQIPSDVRCIFDFMHWTWWEGGAFENAAKGKENWCISTTYVENGLVRAGWAGNMPSTRTKSNNPPYHIRSSENKSFAYVSLYGSLGPYIGSYDENRFLERFAVRLTDLQRKGTKVYVNFSNTDSTTLFPLHPLFISGYVCCPKIGRQDIPDTACSLHDSQRLKKVVDIQSRCPYNINDDGYVKVHFQVEN